jgi:hypothetical protein
MNDDLSRNMAQVGESIGVETSLTADAKPSVLLTRPLNEIAGELGALAHRSQLFRMGERYVTVDARTGDMRGMPADRFCSFAETLACLVKPGGDSVKASRMAKELARGVLAADVFRGHVRELRGVNRVRVPVWRERDGERTVELLPEGFDAETGCYTVDSLPFDQDMEPDDARDYLLGVHKDFPWCAEAPIEKNRDFAAHLAACVGVFCSCMLPRSEDRLMPVYCANQAGSGKTNLARIALAPVHGEISIVNAGSSKGEELNKTLDALMLERAPYIVLDDLPDLRNPKLNALLTSPLQSVRVMGGSVMEKVRVEAHVIATGNQIRLTPDLERRTLAVDLFHPGDAMTRTFERPITKTWIFAESNRAALLAAFWALVRHWRARGCPVHKEAFRGGFEAYSQLVGSILMECQFANPFSPRASTFGGDEKGAAMLELLKALAAKVDKGTQAFTSDDVYNKAIDCGLLEEIVPVGKDPGRTFGHALKPFIGREFTDSRGRSFRFGRRETRSRKTYPITIIAEP